MIDPDSETWRDVLSFCEKARASALAAILAHGTGIEMTEFARGQLDVLGDLTRLPDQQHAKPLNMKTEVY